MTFKFIGDCVSDFVLDPHPDCDLILMKPGPDFRFMQSTQIAIYALLCQWCNRCIGCFLVKMRSYASIQMNKSKVENI